MMWPVAITFKKVYIYHLYTVTIFCVKRPQLNEVPDTVTINIIRLCTCPGLKVTIMSRSCDISNHVAFCHNKL